MTKKTVGLSDIALYIPPLRMDLDSLVKWRVRQNAGLERRLHRAVTVTGQQSFRFPEAWQDNATLAAQSSYRLVAQSPDTDYSKTRYLAVGTETTVDHSKPVAAFVEGMLQQSGLPIPESISTFQVQHACAGGTIALLSVSALLTASVRDGENGIVVCSDIARYDAPSTAEVTQGAGAVSLLVENNPRLLNLDLGTQGYFSRDVDDFFRPLGSTTAKVKGSYSVQCYNEALESAFLDHCDRRGEAPEDVLQTTDMFAFHVPFHNMAVMALQKLVNKYLGLTGEAADEFLSARGFSASLEAARRIGNIYSGSAYLALAFLLKERYETMGDEVRGKNVILASYGSGNTMTVIGGSVAQDAPSVISNWDLDAIWRNEREATFAEYDEWIGSPLERDAYNAILKNGNIPHGSFYLEKIRDDGYREYAWK